MMVDLLVNPPLANVPVIMFTEISMMGQCIGKHIKILGHDLLVPIIFFI
jgi:hypothetical protein